MLTQIQRKDLRTLHELRQSGEARRFSDEMEYILAGLASSESINVFRSRYARPVRSIGFYLNTFFLALWSFVRKSKLMNSYLN
jgi:hypothetical protein